MITYASFCYIIVLCYHRIYDILYSYTTYDGCRSRSTSLLSPLSGMHSGLDSSRICCTIASDNLTLHCRLHSTAYSSILHCWLLPNAALCCVSAAVLYGPVLPVLTAQSVGLRIRVGKLHVKNQHVAAITAFTAFLTLFLFFQTSLAKFCELLLLVRFCLLVHKSLGLAVPAQNHKQMHLEFPI
jgi:hypothetical protein